MSVRIGCGLSTEADARLGAAQAAAAARNALGEAEPDLVMVFASGAHLAAPEATLEGVLDELDPGTLAGCGAGGVLAEGREVEHGTAVTVWAAELDGGSAEAFHAELIPTGEGTAALTGLPDLGSASALLVLADPYSFPSDSILDEVSRRWPAVPVIGGLSSARTLDGECALLCDDSVVHGGAVGVRLQDVEVLPCVSQGAAPLGPELTVTAAEAHVIHELDGRPALQELQAAVDGLAPDELRRVANGLLLGIVVEPGVAEHAVSDYLVRSLLGADPEHGSVSVGATVQPGQIVRLHARDPGSADRDLREALELRREALGGRPPAGALVFSCNGRGSGMFGVPDHDATTVADALGGAPTAGFFAAGEIGPVAGRPFLHGFTATLAVFAP